MDTKTEKKTEEKKENKETEAKKGEKFDFKVEAKKWWNGFVHFIRPYKNLDQKQLSDSMEPLLKRNISMIYLIGCCILGFFTLYTLFGVAGLGAKLTGLLFLLIVFVLFRLTCELLSKKN